MCSNIELEHSAAHQDGGTTRIAEFKERRLLAEYLDITDNK
jgi:hypothetical protein